MVDTGKLRERIILQAPTNTRDAYGGETVTWTDIATIWAAVWPRSGKEYFATQQRQAEISLQIRIRYRTDVKAGWRIKHGNVYYDIEAVINTNYRRESLDLMCTEAAT